MRFARAALLVAGLCAALACDGRPRSEPATSKPPKRGPGYAIVDLTAGAPEIESQGLFGPPPGKRRSFDALLETLHALPSQKDVKGVFVRFGGGRMGLARATELGVALGALRDKMPVYCHGHGYDNASLLVSARGCTQVWVSPAGGVDAIGLAAQVVYMRRLLADELHLDVNFLQVGKFKGAEEPFTRDGPSDEARASLEGTLSDLRKSWLEGIATGKKRADLPVEDGPYAPKVALARGLVDAVGYEDEATEALEKQIGARRPISAFGPGASDGDEIDELLRSLGGGGSSAPIVVVRAVGQITMGGGSAFGGAGITEGGLARQLSRIERDDDVKAIVLRIDSPGGSALASDLLWHKLMKLRKSKKIVVSVGDMAASGGYYLASTADVIFADPTSIVGSIGVVGGKVAFGTALERLGVHAETFAADAKNPAARARAAYESPLVAWDEPTKARVLESMKSIYDLFLARVAEGRKLPVEKISTSAEGRIFSGREGKDRGLVDELGGLEDAIAKARALAGLPDDAAVDVSTGRARFVDVMGLEDGAEGRAPVLSAIAHDELSGAIRSRAPWLADHVASLEPLANGEAAVCAVPFALTVH